MGKIQLFNNSDEEEEPVEFKTNKSYAKHYDEFRKKEILGQLKNVESDETSSSEDETTDEEVVDPDFDKEFFRTLAYLKRQDPAKYEEKPTFFEHVKPVEEAALEKRKKKEKPMTLKDYERQVILEKGGVYEDEDDVVPDRKQREASPSLMQQQEQIKDDIKRALSKIDTDDEDESDAVGGLLVQRSKNKDEQEKEQADYLQWLADRKMANPPSEDVKSLEPLKHFWNSKKLSKEDAFLKDYILNKRFVDSSGDVPSYEDIVATSEDEEELEKQEEYERQYNFRFEEPDAEYIKRYPRNIDESVRVEHNKRKEQRKLLKERKQREKEQKKRELEELKAMKLQEIKEKIDKLKEIAATENMVIKEEDLESDFDPDEHDRRMQRMFDDNYYGVDEGDQKPEFPELDEELGIENYDREQVHSDGEGQNANEGPHCEDDDFVMDADYVANQKTKKAELQEELLRTTGAKKKKGKRVSKFAEMLKKERPLFDPEDEKTYGEYIDEYYKLDYEDVIGDMPCRFRYVETVPNDFGLSIEEILLANTRELNRWASVKKTVQIRPKYSELNEIDVYKRKAQNESLKRKILPSLYKQQEESDEDDEIKTQKQAAHSKEETAQASGTSNKTPEVSVKTEKHDKNDKQELVQPLNTIGKKKKKKKGLPTNIKEEHDTATIPEKQKEQQKVQTYRKNLDKHPSAPNQNNNKEKPKKRKHNDGELHEKNREFDKFQTKKKKKFNDKSSKPFQQSQQLPNVSDDRLRAFGINPRKFYNKLKYGSKNQDHDSHSGQKNKKRFASQNGGHPKSKKARKNVSS